MPDGRNDRGEREAEGERDGQGLVRRSGRRTVEQGRHRDRNAREDQDEGPDELRYACPRNVRPDTGAEEADDGLLVLATRALVAGLRVLPSPVAV